MLYFGCRHKNEDFLYQEELEEFEKTGVLTALNVAFSRDQAQKVQYYTYLSSKILMVVILANNQLWYYFL